MILNIGDYTGKKLSTHIVSKYTLTRVSWKSNLAKTIKIKNTFNLVIEILGLFPKK